MRGGIEDLLSEIAPPEQQSAFHVQKIPHSESYYIGRDGLGNPAMLVKATGEGRSTPIRLAGIEARYGVSCAIAEPGAAQRTETPSVIICTLRERGVEALFARL